MNFGSKKTYLSKRQMGLEEPKPKAKDLSGIPENEEEEDKEHPKLERKNSVERISEYEIGSDLEDNEEEALPTMLYKGGGGMADKNPIPERLMEDKVLSIQTLSAKPELNLQKMSYAQASKPSEKNYNLIGKSSMKMAAPEQSIPKSLAIKPQKEVKAPSSGGFFGGISNFFSKKEEPQFLAMDASKERCSVMKASKPKLEFRKAKEKEKNVYKANVDTNVICIELNSLKDKGSIGSGNPVLCEKCKAMYSKYSKSEIQEGKQIWKCEFCENINNINIEEGEIPNNDTITYITQSVHQIFMDEDISVLFCIDISGSMSVSQEVKDSKHLKYDKTAKLKELMKFSDGSLQYMNNERHNAVYVSRIQCVQAAVESQIDNMSKGAPNRKVGIITFNNEVNIIGDGNQNQYVIAGDKLNDLQTLIDIGKNEGIKYLTTPIKDSKVKLCEKLMQIEESGSTALGPALIASISMLDGAKPGSKVIICTDGLANVGLGSLDTLKTEEEFNKAKEFYEKVGQIAKEKKLSISIISIVSEECRLEMLSPLADLTGGDILKVNPLNLSSDFANILSQNLVATEVNLKVKLHKGLSFRNEDNANLSEKNTLLTKNVGNAYEGQEITFEYSVKSAAELKEADVDFDKLKAIPFQAQIAYNSLDGHKCIKCLTRMHEFTYEMEEAKKDMNSEAISVNVVQAAGKMAKKGQLREAQAYTKIWSNELKADKAAYKEVSSNLKPLYKALNKQQEKDFQEDQMNNLMEMNELEHPKFLSEQAPIQLSSEAPKLEKKGQKKKELIDDLVFNTHTAVNSNKANIYKKK